MNNVVAFIFARGGSKGLPRKNVLDFCGKPLIAWSIEQANSVQKIDRVIVSTDCEEIAKLAVKYGAEVPFMRPSELGQDTSPEWDSWRHALNYIREEQGSYPEVIVSVPTTSPLRSVSDIEKCIDLFQKEKPDAVITVTDAQRNPYFNMVKETTNGRSSLVFEPAENISNRQAAPKIYDMTTVAYVVKSDFVIKNTSLFDGDVVHVHVPRERAIDIDHKIDFDFAELIMKKNQSGKPS